MIKIKIEAVSGEDARNQMLALIGLGGGAIQDLSQIVAPLAIAGADAPAPENGASTKKRSAPKKVEATTDDFAAPVESETDLQQSGDEDYSKLSDDAVLEIMLGAKNRPGIAAILKEMGYERRTDVPKEKLHDFVVKVKALEPEPTK